MKISMYLCAFGFLVSQSAYSKVSRSFYCTAKEGRLVATARFMVEIDAKSGDIKYENGSFRNNLKHVNIEDSQGQKHTTLVFVTDAEKKTDKETYLRFFWNLKDSMGEYLSEDDCENRDVSEGDLYFYGGTQSDMNQSELVVFREDDYQKGEFRFRVNGELLYKTELTCKGPFETMKTKPKSKALDDLMEEAHSIQRKSPLDNGDTLQHDLRAVRVHGEFESDLLRAKAYLHDEAEFSTDNLKTKALTKDLKEYAELVQSAFYDDNDLSSPEEDRPTTPEAFKKLVDDFARSLKDKSDSGLMIHHGSYSGSGGNEKTVKGLFIYDPKTKEAIFISTTHSM